MYLTFYGLSEKPFGQTPDPKFLYWNDAYRETIASLRYGIQERKGFITMIGEAGTGKTTLLRKLLDDLGPDVVSVFLFNPNATFEEILEYTLGELGIPAPAGRKLAMLQRLNEFLLAAFQEGKNTILLIDEAQDLETDVLESLRLLSNLETSKEKILQIVLSGQPELATRLAQPNLRQLKQRIAVRCRLEPLTRPELQDYIAARLAVAGGRPDLFDAATLDPIWTFAQGIPRLVNAVCDNALLVGYALGRQTIDAEVIGEVVADLRKIDAPVDLPPDPATILPPLTATASAAVALTPAAPSAAAPIATPEAAPAAPSAPVVPASPPPGPAPAAVVAPKPPLAPRGTAHAPPAAPAPGRATPRRAVGFVLAAGLLLALAAVGAFAASRWDEIRPRVRALLTEPGDEAATAPARPPTQHAAPAEPSAASAPALAAPVAGEIRPDPAGQAPATVAAPAADPQVAADSAPSTGTADAPAVDPAPSSGTVGAAAGTSTGPAAESERVATAATEPTAADAPEPAPAPVVVTSAPAPARAASQDLQLSRRAVLSGKRVQVQLGDTLMNLAAREYGGSTYTALDVVRSANPGIQDVDRIIAGSEIVFPDPGPGSRVTGEGDELTVLVGTTPALGQAQELQRLAGARFRLRADLEPIPLGDGRNLYRVSLHNVPSQAQAREIAESLGSILEDPS